MAILIVLLVLTICFLPDGGITKKRSITMPIRNRAYLLTSPETFQQEPGNGSSNMDSASDIGSRTAAILQKRTDSSSQLENQQSSTSVDSSPKWGDQDLTPGWKERFNRKVQEETEPWMLHPEEWEKMYDSRNDLWYWVKKDPIDDLNGKFMETATKQPTYSETIAHLRKLFSSKT